MQFEASSLRKDYLKGSLDEKTVLPDPFTQFRTWLDAAIEAKLIEANAMAVATVGSDGIPSVRTVLLKELSADGFVFGTNFESLKGQQLAENPNVSLLFYWPALERQVRVTGTCEQTTPEESDNLFYKRPVEARVSAVASPQSQVIPDRAWIQEKTEKLWQSLPEGEGPPRPESWGGYRIRPTMFEFWQGRQNRMHDRIRYRLEGSDWIIERLAP
jgi:pyridoxamine 5'-phosphate oxidase